MLTVALLKVLSLSAAILLGQMAFLVLLMLATLPADRTKGRP